MLDKASFKEKIKWFDDVINEKKEFLTKLEDYDGRFIARLEEIGQSKLSSPDKDKNIAKLISWLKDNKHEKEKLALNIKFIEQIKSSLNHHFEVSEQYKDIIEDLYKDIEEKDDLITKLNAKLDEKQDNSSLDSQDDSLTAHGLCSLVIRKRREGVSDEEIAKELQERKCSVPQIGALLYKGEGIIEAGSLTKYAQRLLGKA